MLALAAAAKYFNLPTILTTSFENGPLVPELSKMFLDAPYIAAGCLIHILPDVLGGVQLVYASRKRQCLVIEKRIEHLVDDLHEQAENV